MSFEWSQPQFKGSCDLKGFALFMDNGDGVLTEIDSAQIRNKPLKTTHTT